MCQADMQHQLTSWRHKNTGMLETDPIGTVVMFKSFPGQWVKLTSATLVQIESTKNKVDIVNHLLIKGDDTIAHVINWEYEICAVSEESKRLVFAHTGKPQLGIAVRISDFEQYGTWLFMYTQYDLGCLVYMNIRDHALTMEFRPVQEDMTFLRGSQIIERLAGFRVPRIIVVTKDEQLMLPPMLFEECRRELAKQDRRTTLLGLVNHYRQEIDRINGYDENAFLGWQDTVRRTRCTMKVNEYMRELRELDQPPYTSLFTRVWSYIGGS